MRSGQFLAVTVVGAAMSLGIAGCHHSHSTLTGQAQAGASGQSSAAHTRVLWVTGMT